VTLAKSGASESEALPDAVAHPLWRLAPDPIRPFLQLARLDRPIGWQLLMLPCWEGTALAGMALHQAPNLFHLTLFFIGAVSMRGAGSTFNDIVDRDIDTKVERTRGRPIASGRVSVKAATAFFVVQCLIGLAVLLSFNALTIVTALVSPLIFLVYPFAKRFTSWPQAILGCAFAYGALVGWTATTNSLDPPALLLYAAAILWTIGYDTIYAIQDVRDDMIAGVRSTARLFGARVQGAVALLYAGSVLSAELAVLSVGGGALAQAGVVAYALHLSWQVANTKPDLAPQQALMLFRANRDAGLLLFGGLFLQSLLA
jgi:4-hydroxybenzoate polyprenyltransferase